MHNIWNPWHSCTKCSDACHDCKMYYMDKLVAKGDKGLHRTWANFIYPIQKDENGSYKVQSGEMLLVSISADFFLEKADGWRADAWSVMRKRSDVVFVVPTKRPERIMDCLPDDWGDGWENVFINVVCEDQRSVDERVPIMMKLPFKHKGIMLTPIVGEVSIAKYLKDGQISRVVCGGEEFDGGRPCDFSWIKKLQRECVTHNVTFCFSDTGTEFVKDGWRYHIVQRKVRNEMAFKTGVNYIGKPIKFRLFDQNGREIPESKLYVPVFHNKCQRCANKPICNGYFDCSLCDDTLYKRQTHILRPAEPGWAFGLAY